MPMPKTTVYEDDGAPNRQYQVGSAGQATIVQRVAQSKRMQIASNNQLRGGILPPDALHERRTGWRGVQRL